jgi:serine protease Do
MNNEIELINKIEDYLLGRLSDTDRAAFEKLRSADPEVDHKVIEHAALMQSLRDYSQRKEMALELDKIHQQIDVAALVDEFTPTGARVISLWKRYRINAAVAAAVALLAVFSTLLITGYFSKSNSNYNVQLLRREFNNLKKSIRSNVHTSVTGPVNPGQFGGTGFALSADGYLITNYHVVKDADSIYIQASNGNSYKVEIVNQDPLADVAVLKITDPNFTELKNLPYTFKKSVSDLGEDVFTMGYPKDDLVIGKGYLSSKTGYSGDTTAYQISIAVNPGNSGGPLFDSRGNVIGIINSKQQQSDGVAFATKSDYFLKFIETIPQDSLKNKLGMNKKNALSGLRRTDQIKKLEDYVFMVKVY